LEVAETVPIVCKPNKYNIKYLETKEQKLGHKLGLAKDKSKTKQS
jgi:3,4-dihydroxy 2-butanone 4-phosphate synthase/GTP cyclohydrolase II